MPKPPATMDSTSGRPWIMPDPWATPLDHNFEPLLESNPNEIALSELDAVGMGLSALATDFAFEQTLTDSPFSSTISDVGFLDDLDYTSPTSSSMESSPRLPGDIHDPLAADFSYHVTTDPSAWSQSVLRIPPMFDDMTLQFPANDLLSTWPLFSPPIPNQPAFPSGVELTASGSVAPSLPPTSHVFPCPSCDKDFDAKQKLRQHKRHVHLKPASCTICGKRFGSTRDLTRHTETHHPEVAASLPAESQRSRCPEPGCGYKGRKDNVIRHCRAKHGKDASRRGQGSPIFDP